MHQKSAEIYKFLIFPFHTGIVRFKIYNTYLKCFIRPEYLKIIELLKIQAKTAYN